MSEQMQKSTASANVETPQASLQDRPVYLETKDLVVGYDGVPLLTDVNIQLHAGEIMTLIGPNGAGKSTILKSIVAWRLGLHFGEAGWRAIGS